LGPPPPPPFSCLLYIFSHLKLFSREFLAQTAKTCRRFYIYGVPATAGVPGVTETESKEKHGAGVDYNDNLTLCPLQSRPYPYARESTFSPSQLLWI
jgi:hypothetical protein